MSDAKGFRRCDGFAGSIPQNWINGNFPVCPMCGSMDPYWTLKDKMGMTANRVLFRCKDCGCIMSATVADFTGATKSKAFAALTTGGLINAISKKKQGKDVQTVYIKIEDVGDFQLDKSIEGTEMPVDELKKRARAYMGQPVAPAPMAVETEPQEEMEIKVSYAEPSVEKVQLDETEIKVSYAMEEKPMQVNNVAYAAPSASAATQEEKYAAPGFLKIFAFICAFCYFFSFIKTLVVGVLNENFTMIARGYLLETLPLVAMVLICLGLFGKNKLFAIGCLALAGYSFIALLANSIGYTNNTFSGILNGLSATAAYTIIGLHFMLKGKPFNARVKMILAIAHGALAGLFALIAFTNIIGWIHILNNLFSLTRIVFMTLILILFNPYKEGANNG